MGTGQRKSSLSSNMDSKEVGEGALAWEQGALGSDLALLLAQGVTLGETLSSLFPQISINVRGQRCHGWTPLSA